MAATTSRGRVTAPSHGPFRRRVLAVIAAALAALLAWSVAVPLLDVELTVRTSAGGGSLQTISPGLVLVVSLLASLLGWGLLAMLERRTPRAGIVWTVTAVIGLLLSLAGPLTAAVTTAAAAALVLLHLSVAAALIPLLRRTAPSAEAQPC